MDDRLLFAKIAITAISAGVRFHGKVFFFAKGLEFCKERFKFCRFPVPVSKFPGREIAQKMERGLTHFHVIKGFGGKAIDGKLPRISFSFHAIKGRMTALIVDDFKRSIWQMDDFIDAAFKVDRRIPYSHERQFKIDFCILGKVPISSIKGRRKVGIDEGAPSSMPTLRRPFMLLMGTFPKMQKSILNCLS